MPVQAQENLIISGKVLDSKTKSPLAFASITQANSFRGVATNQDGEFRFIISTENATDSIIVRYVGYRSESILPSSLRNTNIIVMLDAEDFEVGEILVKSKRRSAEEIMKKALSSFSKNYFNESHIIKGFYREITYENRREVLVSEATIDILKSGYRNLGMEEKVKLTNSRKVQPKSYALNSGFISEGGVFYRNEDDLIKNRPTFLLKEYLPYYSYKTDRVLGSGDDAILILGFIPNRSTINSMEADNMGPAPLLKSTDIMYSGEIFINQSDYSIVKVDYWLDKDKLRYAESNFITSKPEGAVVELKKARFMAEYRRNSDNKYALSLTSGTLNFNVRGGGFPRGTQYEVYNEFMAYDLISDNIDRNDFRKIEDSSTTLENVSNDYDPEFWNNDNIISARKRTSLLGNRDYEELLLMDNIAQSLNKDRSSELFHLHIDRQRYLQGEDIFFKAYTLDSYTGYPSKGSKSFYVYLKNKQNNLIDTARFKLNDGIGRGSLTLKKDLAPGLYELIAFPSQMQNFDTDNVFSQEIAVTGRMSFIDEVATKKADSIEVIQKPSKESINIFLLPEGGVLLDDAVNNIGIITLNKEGDPVSARVEIVDNNQNIIDSVQTNGSGIGEFLIRIQKEREYFARIKEGAKIYLSIASFPERNTHGLNIRLVSNRCDTLRVIVSSNRSITQEAHLILTQGKQIIKTQSFKVSNESIQEIIFDSSIGGIGSLTLFDGHIPVAERLLLLNPDKRLHISAQTEYLGYPAKSLVRLKIKTTDSDGYPVSADLSLSVIDSLNGRAKHTAEKNILYSYWFKNSISKQVPLNLTEYMSDKLSRSSKIDNNEIDRFLLCYGWRKITIKDRLQKDFQEELSSSEDYDAINIEISQRNERKTISVPKINITSLKSLEYHPLQTNKNSEGSFSVPSHLMESKIIVGFDNSKKARKWKIDSWPELNQEFLPEVLKNEKPRGAFQPKEALFDINDLRIDKDLIVLDEVTVKGVDGSKKSRKLRIDEAIDFSSMTASFSGTPEEHPETMGILDLLSKIAPPRMIDRAVSSGKVYYRVVYKKPLGSPFIEVPVVFILNDIPISKNYHDLYNIKSSDIDHITVVKGPQAFFFWGDIARGGAVLVYTKDLRTEIPIPKSEYQAFLTLKPLCSVSREFFAPVYDTPESKLIEDYRTTIHWEPDIITDQNGEAIVEFYNTGNNSLVIGNIQGITQDGLSGFQKFRYRINKE